MTITAVPKPPSMKPPSAPAPRTDVIVWTRRTCPGQLWSVVADIPSVGFSVLGSGEAQDHRAALEQVNAALRNLNAPGEAVIHVTGSGETSVDRRKSKLSQPQIELPKMTRLRDPYESGDFQPGLLEFAAQSCSGMITGTEVRIATDGSVSHFNGHAGYGWIAETGQFGVGVLGVQHDVENAELAAIDDAMSRVRGARGALLIDSERAIELIELRLRGDRRLARTKAQNAKLNSIDRSPIRDMRLEKVKGHSGHILHDAADRLSRLARRASEHGLDARTVWNIASGIRDETMARLRAAKGVRHALDH